MKNKLLKRIISAFLLIFAIINIFWFINWYKYNDYKDAVGYDDIGDRYFTVDSEGYRFAVFAPDYLRFTGNLTVGNNLWEEESENCTCSLIIWPLFNGDYNFGINIYVPISSETGYTYECYSFLLNENGECLTENLSSDEERILNENYSLIQKTYEKAHDMWGIGG